MIKREYSDKERVYMRMKVSTNHIFFMNIIPEKIAIIAPKERTT